MSCVNFNKVSLTFGIHRVLSEANFSLPKGLKVGLVGENGCGKSTILKLICGELKPDSGCVETASDLAISRVRQLPVPGSYINAVCAVLDSQPQVARLYTQLAELEQCSKESSRLRYADLVAQYSSIGGYELEAEVKRFLSGLSLSDKQIAMPFDLLSGGEQARVNLAAALLARPQLLLLDEPDRHLDIPGLRWLQSQLKKYNGTLVLVSHDRELLEGCIDAVIELEDGCLRFEHGSLEDYFRRKQQRIDRQTIEYLEQQSRVAKLRRDIRRTEEKARSFDNRSTNDHWRRIGKKIARTAVARKHRLERELDDASRIEKPEDREQINLKFAEREHHNSCLLLATGLSKRYDGLQLFDQINIELHRGQRTVITGPNGCGKTTLLEVLLGKQTADWGEIWFPRKATVFYCDQHHGGLDLQQTAYATLEGRSGLTTNQIHYALSQIGLKNRNVHKPVSVLSGGERTRLLLALLSSSQADLLVLDEPTSHLDLPSVRILEQVLSRFSGAVLFVSHDRQFIRSVATDVLKLENCVLGHTEV